MVAKLGGGKDQKIAPSMVPQTTNHPNHSAPCPWPVGTELIWCSVGITIITAMITLTYLEFYSGIGGWGYALEHALRNIAAPPPPLEQPQLHCQLLCAYDHSDICKNVFVHNHNQNKKLFRQTPIERITREQLETHSAHIWCMSPVSECV